METETNVEEVKEDSTPSPEKNAEISQEDSATSAQKAETTEEPAPQKSDETNSEYQKRINRITAEKYDYLNKYEDEKKRREELEQQLNTKKQTVEVGDMPTLASCDYDEEKHQVKLAEYFNNLAEKKARDIYVNQGKEQTERQRQAEKQRVKAEYYKKVDEFIKTKPDYAESVKNMPIVNQNVVDALLDIGPEVTYHLSKNLDIVDRLNGMSPVQIGITLGSISRELSTVNKKTLSKAPEPIEPVQGSGVINTSAPGDELISHYTFE